MVAVKQTFIGALALIIVHSIYIEQLVRASTAPSIMRIHSL